MGLVDDLIATAQPRTQQVRICARGDLVAAHAAAVQALAEATADDESLEGDPRTVEMAEAVVAVETEMEAATVTFTIGSVSRQTWADLLAAHPPTKEQRRAGQDHDPDKFPVAMVAACVIDPPTTAEQVTVLAGNRADGAPVLPPGEWVKLVNAAFFLNVTETPTPKLGAATELLRVNGRSSTTPPTAAFPEAGSSAGSGAQ